MNLCRLALPLLSAFVTVSALAQSPQPRLRGAISSSARTALAGSASPRTLHAQDLGRLPDTERISGITLVFRRSPAQQAELDQLLQDQGDPASPEFHHWLTPETFGDRFGMAETDLLATEGWLTSEGFQVTGRSRARDRITFSGTAAEVQAAFGTSLHRFQVDGESHFAPAADLSLPAALAPLTAAVLHLSTFRPKPQVHPDFTSGRDQTHHLTPPDLAVMYDLPQDTARFQLGFEQGIAIVGQSFVDTSESSVVPRLAQFNGSFTLNSVLVPGTGVEAVSPGDAAESELDLEYAAIDTSANLFLVHVGSSKNYNVFDALAFAIDQNIAPVISISYSECETFLSQTDIQGNEALFQQATSQGQTLVAAAGDSGSTACAPATVGGSFTAGQQQALAVSYPASSPSVTAVGGTQMTPAAFAAGNTALWSAPPGSTFNQVSSLLGYAPEIAWNEDSTTLGIFAGGGGSSAVFPRPAWQSALPGIPAGSNRLLPDIALQASGQNPGLLFCTDDPAYTDANGQLPICATMDSSYPVIVGGGTSFAAPTFAAVVALLNQSTHELGQGNLNSTLYRLAGTPSVAAAVFHDITDGSIACIPGTPRCSAAGQSGFAAGVGYDQAIGLGSLDVSHLLAAWPANTSHRQATNLALQAFNTAPGPGDSDSLHVYVTAGLDGTSSPTGTVSVAIDGSVVNSSVSLTPGALAYIHDSSVDYTFLAPTSSGSHLLSVLYGGDATHLPTPPPSSSSATSWPQARSLSPPPPSPSPATAPAPPPSPSRPPADTTAASPGGSPSPARTPPSPSATPFPPSPSRAPPPPPSPSAPAPPATPPCPPPEPPRAPLRAPSCARSASTPPPAHRPLTPGTPPRSSFPQLASSSCSCPTPVAASPPSSSAFSCSPPPPPRSPAAAAAGPDRVVTAALPPGRVPEARPHPRRRLGPASTPSPSPEVTPSTKAYPPPPPSPSPSSSPRGPTRMGATIQAAPMPPYVALTLGILSRLVPSLLHYPGRNLTAVGASLLLFGARRPAREIPLAALALALTDFLLTTVAFHTPFHLAPYLLTWLWYLAIPLLGRALLRPRPTHRLLPRAIAATLLAAGSFFLLSNGSVWLFDPIYPHTPAGLLACYAAGLPFLRNDLLSTALSLALFLAPSLHLSPNRAADPHTPAKTSP